MSAALLFSGCPDDDGPATGAAADDRATGEGEGEASSPCQQLCERLDAEELLCGGNDLGRSVSSCTLVCEGGAGVPEGLDVAGVDCRTLTDALPDGLLLPCMCAPDPAGFAAITAGPLTACSGCHPSFVGEGGYDEVVGRIGDLLHPDEGSLFCNAMGCRAHPGQDAWKGSGSCEWRSLVAWVADAAPPGDDCEAFDEAVDCVTLCGDEPPAEVECEAGDQPDPEDFCRFVAQVEPGIVADCGGCHAGGMGGFQVTGGDSDANYAAALGKADREDPDASMILTAPVGGGAHPEIWQAGACKMMATRAWIARAPAPDCVGGP